MILVLLNGLPATAIVDSRADLTILSLDIIKWAGVPKIDCDCPRLIMGEGMKVQPI